MRITLDHNCIINLENRTEIGVRVEAIVSNKNNQCFVVNIGASEMREKGVRPDQYGKFEELLESARVAHLPRLNPMMIWDVTFWDQCVWAEEETTKLADAIEAVLFSEATAIGIASENIGSPMWRKWLNRKCDVQGMWCHIQNQNEIFLTTDSNFTKETKLSKLLALGAGRICHPNEI
jgi:hypothetical protein